MTATRVVDDHFDLQNSGVVPHSTLDNIVTSTTWLVVSGSNPLPAQSRILVAGAGISLVDNGPGSTLVITSTALATGSNTSWMERPIGLADGVNKTFQLGHVPNPASAVMFFVNGLLQEQGTGSDYNIVSGSTIQLLYNYRSGSNLRSTYPY
jgi:hypothetical protein